MHRRAIESLNTSFVPHSRLFSLHPSLVSQNSSLSHGLGAMNSCGSMHGLCMHDNSLVMHDNSWGALSTIIHVHYMLLEFGEEQRRRVRVLGLGIGVLL